MENWKTVRLGDVCEILNGYAFKSDKYVDSGIRVIRITNVQKGFIEDNSPAFYPITEKENLKDYELYENDLLISLTGNVGRVALLSKEMLPAALNQRVGCIRIRDKNLLISYLFTFLNSDKFESDCIYSARGIAQKNMSTEWLKNYLIPLPPIEVQIKIANNLNTCAKIIKKHNKQLNNFDLLIKSRFIEMFGDPVENPKQWNIVKLKSLTAKIGSGATPKGGRESYISEGISLVRSMNVYKGFFEYEGLAHITEAQAKELDNVTLQENDVLINITGASVARCCILPKDVLPARVNQHVSILRATEKLNPVYLSNLLITDTEQRVLLGIGGAGGATREAITKTELETLDIPVPPLELQNDFASFVQQIDKSKFAVQKSLEKTEILYKSLMQAYFG